MSDTSVQDNTYVGEYAPEVFFIQKRKISAF